MKRKMVWIGTAWMIGLLLSAICRTPWTVYLLLAAWMLLGAFRLFRRLTTGQMLCVGISLSAAVGVSLAYTALVYQPAIAHDGSITTFSGRVTSVTIYDNDRASYQVKGKFRDGTCAKVLVYNDDVGAEYGDTLHVAGTFSALEDTYLWSAGAYYWAKGIFLQTQGDAYVTYTSTDRGWLTRQLNDYRSWISTRICAFAGTDAGGMVSAMLLGTSETLNESDEVALAHSGISHILSVSGLHLVLLLGVWVYAAKRMKMHRYGLFGGLVVWTVLYTLLVGAPVSMLRAGMMFLLIQSAPLFFRRADTCNSLCIAGIILTLPNPYLILDASFLLSITGTFGIGVFAPWMTRRMQHRTPLQRIRRNFAAMVCVSICVFPVSLCYFREVSVISPIANVLLVPIASLMLLLSLLIFLTGGIGLVAKPVCLLLHLLYKVLMVLSYGLQRLVPVMFPVGWKLLPLLAWILVGFVIVVYAAVRKPRGVLVAVSLSFVLLLSGQMIYRWGESRQFQVAILGDSSQTVVVISCHDKTDVIDLTGNHRNPQYVAAYLQERGICKIDSLCLTKRVSQMRVAYPDVLGSVTAEAVVVPTNAALVQDTRLFGASVQQADMFTLQDVQYAVIYGDGGLTITYGTMQFYVGTNLKTLPDGTWDAVIGTAWNGTDDTMPEGLYLKDEPIRLRIEPDGTWYVEELG